MKLITLLILSILGGVFLGIIFSVKGKTFVGIKIKHWKLGISSKLPNWFRYCLLVVGIIIGLFGPSIVYILVFPSDSPLIKVFSPVQVFGCVVLSGLISRILDFYL